MWADHETEFDLLGFQHLVSAVAQIAGSDALLPATVGVFGDWGSGKSSLLKMAADELAGDQVAVLMFNGWLFEGYDDAKSALMETIIDELAAMPSLTEKGKKVALRLLRKVNWFRLAGTALKYGAAASIAGPPGLALLAGIDAAEAAKKVGETLEGVEPEELVKLIADEPRVRKNVREFRTEFEELIKEAKLDRVVVVIDDLDRCLPDTVIATLEAIKLFLFVPRSAFIIGADERLVRYAVRRRFPELPGESASVGRDYLEKLIQYPVRIPRLARAEIQTYTSLLFAQAAGYSTEELEPARAWVRSTENLSKGRAFGVDEAKSCLGGEPEKEFAENLALASRIAPLLAEMSSCNPRQVKRFLNTMRMRVAMAASRGVTLKNDVLAKLMLLEEFRLAAFKELAQAQADEDGTPRLLGELESGGGERPKPVRKLVQRGRAEEPPADDEGEGDVRTSAESPNDQLAAWRNDPWLVNWVAFEPPLAGEDLRPYFYVSRDVLGPVSGASQRLSADAQEYLIKLLHESDAVRKAALSKAGELSEGDAAAIFEDLASRAQTEGDRSLDNSAFQAMLALCGERSELTGTLVSTLESFAENALPMSVAPEVARVCKGTPGEQAAKALLERWSQSGGTNLKRAAESALKRLT